MRALRWEFSPWAVLALALLYFFDGSGLLSALAPAVLVHELGHAAALAACGAHVHRVRLGLFGIELDYSGALNRGETLLCLAAGPVAGLLYALAACGPGSSWEYLSFSGALSFCLSLFNLLPALPLDGGRILAELTRPRTAARVSLACAVLVTLSGGALLLRFHTPAPLGMGLWLCSRACQDLAGGAPGAEGRLSAKRRGTASRR